MRILVTGAGGGLGGEIPAVFADADDELTLLSHADCDITDAVAVSRAVTAARPELVIHAAAYTNVDRAESEQEAAEAVNVAGTRNIARAAKAADAILIYPSTDYVFDGKQHQPYQETDQPHPLSVYGLTKREGERAALAENPQTYVVRTSWLYAQQGKSFATTMLKLFGERDELSIVADEVSSPTYARDFARVLKDLVAAKVPFGIYHASGDGEASWYDFASEIARQSGSQTKLTKISAAAWGAAAPRPAYSKLDNAKLWQLGIKLPDWKESLQHFFADRAD